MSERVNVKFSQRTGRGARRAWAAPALALALSLGGGAAWGLNVTGWTCQGNCGTATADGVVTNAPVAGSTGYGWVSTDQGISGLALPGVGGDGDATNGSTYTSTPFTAAAGAELAFHFNFVTTDGAGFADYAWARLLDGAGNQVALLFTARTHPTDSVVPGFSMPVPEATLTPATVPIVPGGPAWAPLGPESGDCYAVGCGYSGWVRASYTIADAGTYRLEVGVVNWNDGGYQSGLAVDGLLVGGVAPPAPGATPVPTLQGWGLGLLAAALGGVAAWRRRA